MIFGLLPSIDRTWLVAGGFTLLVLALVVPVIHRRLKQDGADVDVERAREIGDDLTAATKSAYRFLAATYHQFSLGLTSVIPFRSRIMKYCYLRGLYHWYRFSKADAMALNAQEGGTVEITPVKYRAPEDCDEEQKPGWHQKGRDKVWATDEMEVDYLWKTPVALLDDDDHFTASWPKSRIGRAIKLGQHSPVYTDANIVANFDVGGSQPGAGGAVADGGTQFAGLTIDDVGSFAGDNVIDVSSPEGYDGMQISQREANDWFAAASTPEEMQKQEDRGRIAEIKTSMESDEMKWLLIGLVAGASVVLAANYVSGGGGGGGGGGSIMPFMINTVGTIGAL